jgi:multisubunit Na+/H+ antiporter MnhB subunit
MVELYVLLGVMLASALVASETKNLLAAAVALGLIGFSVAIAFILVQAPDLAIVQVVVETLTVVFFAAVILRTTQSDTTLGGAWRPETVLAVVAFVVFGLLVLGAAGSALRELTFGDPRMLVARYYIDAGLGDTGAANVVAAIILDYRGYDTLGEGTVLFTAVIGVLTIMRRSGRKQAGR